MDSFFAKIIVGLLSLFGIVFFSYQIFTFSDSSYTTQFVQIHTYNNTVELNGVVIKDEVLIENQHTGILKYNHSNAQKIKAGQVVANIYSTELDLINSNLIEQLQSELNILTQLQDTTIKGSMNIQSVIANSSKLQIEILGDVQDNDFTDVYSNYYDFYSLLLEQQIAIDNTIDFSAQIADIQAQIATLTTQISTQPVAITAPSAGYFTGNVDGYESIINNDAISNLTVESLQNLINNTSPVDTSGYIGKLQTSTNWKFVSIINTEDVAEFDSGSSIDIIFDENISHDVKTTVEQIISDYEEEYSILILSSNVLNEEIIDIRRATPTVILDSGDGLRVDKNALRMNGDQPGVYVNQGQVVSFKKIDIVYETENYFYSAVVENDNDYLQLYDEVIIEGSDLYDNKPIR